VSLRVHFTQATEAECRAAVVVFAQLLDRRADEALAATAIAATAAKPPASYRLKSALRERVLMQLGKPQSLTSRTRSAAPPCWNGILSAGLQMFRDDDPRDAALAAASAPLASAVFACGPRSLQQDVWTACEDARSASPAAERCGSETSCSSRPRVEFFHQDFAW
jgi:hypothetical protein